MREERRDEAERVLQQHSSEVHDICNVMPALYVREGSPADAIQELIKEEPRIAILVLGAGTNMQMLPSANVAIVVLTNGGPIGAAEAIASQFMDLVQFGETTRDWFAGYNRLLLSYYDPIGDLVGETAPANAAAARPLADYAGSYRNSYFGPAQIRAEGDALTFVLGPEGAVELPLTVWGGDTFAVAPRNENAPDGSLSSVTFTLEEGRATGFTVQYLDGHGLGTWTR